MVAAGGHFFMITNIRVAIPFATYVGNDITDPAFDQPSGEQALTTIISRHFPIETIQLVDRM